MSRRCCCEKACYVFADNFNRANSTTVGDGWVEHSGDWEIDTQTLAANSTGLVYTTAGVSDTRRRIVYVTCLNAQDGKNYRLCPCVKVNSDTGVGTCLVVEFDCGAAGVAYLRLLTATVTSSGTISDGTVVEEHEVSYQAGDNYLLRACLTDTGVYGTLGNQSFLVWDCMAGSFGSKAGIMNAGTAAEYDDFGFYRHALDILPTVDANCPDCDCECEGHCLPKTMTLTIESSCAHRDGYSLTLNFVHASEGTSNWYWEASGTMPGVCSGSAPVYFRLYCFNHDTSYPNRWALCTTDFQASASTTDWGTVDNPTLCTYGGGQTGEMSTGHVCSPLEIVFRTALATCSEPCEICACNDTIRITP